MKDLPEEFLKVPVIDVMDENIVILEESASINECAKVMEARGSQAY